MSARRDEPAANAPELRERVLDALRALLRERTFESLSVAEIIAAAGVSRASFYFYFAGKQAALAELVRRAVGAGHQAAQPWTESAPTPAGDPAAALRAGIDAGATLWLDNAGVLRAIVESWGSDPQLRELWLAQMATFTAATTARIEADPEAMRRLAGADVAAVAASLTWLGERLYYLAACGVPPFDDRAVLVDTLHHVWISTLYPGG
ncbi:HTH-type transcriptional regulator EthR [Actinocatenispora thailandica]|uniref:HTH-type transcriptional regulator EthR n=1 Tax=Actinocatenispora thailandica TaxID=227318 RepID=A0A7R7DSL2_9ACTN|nr:TetR/AcrR family transcriptional regulator [Actinocatenispora thailandica]BCJ36890.1 HTH-type transcriptional regulator EthR [Actinocatenispora thailandica]